MVLAGKVGKDLVAIIETLGGNAVGVCGLDGNMIKVKKADENLGFVGDITDVNVTFVNQLLDNGIIPVVSTIGVDANGNAYNINADTAAARLAGELKAAALINMTDAP